MGLESGTFVSDLVSTNPTFDDKKNQGDDHLRLIKTLLKNTFPNASKAFYFPNVSEKTATYTVIPADDGSYILCNTSAGAYQVFLPVAGINAGFHVNMLKTSLDTNAAFPTPNSGTISCDTGNFTRLRLGVPFELHTFMWNGSTWVRAIGGTPLTGEIIAHTTNGVPAGYALCNGQDILAFDNPELNARWGAGFGSGGAGLIRVPNLTDRFILGRGGSPLGTTGGEINHTLTEAELPVHVHLNTLSQVPHTHGVGGTRYVGQTLQLLTGGGGLLSVNDGTQLAIDAANANISINNANAGSGAAHNNMPPFMVLNYIVRLC